MKERRRSFASSGFERSNANRRGADERLFDVITSSMRDFAIFMVSESGQIKSWNKGAELLFGYRGTEIIGSPIAMLYDNFQEEDTSSEHIRQALSSSHFVTDLWLSEQNEGRFWANISYTSLFEDDQLLGYAVMIRQLTYSEVTSPPGGDLPDAHGQDTESNERCFNPTFLKKLIASNHPLVSLIGENLNLREVTIEAGMLSKQTIDHLSANQYALDEWSIVAITDPDGAIEHVSRNFCRISKYRQDELIGQDHRMVSSGFHDKSFISNMWATLEAGKIWKGELKNKTKDGSFYWVDSTIIPLVNEQAKIYQYMAISSDISVRKKAQEQIQLLNERFSLIASTTKDALFEWDLVTGDIWWSESHYKMFGFDPGLTIPSKQEWLMKIHPKDRSLFTGTSEEIINKGLTSWQNEVMYLKEDGTYGTLLSRAFIVFDDLQQPQKMLGSYIDITERKKEESIKALLSDISLIFNKETALPEMLQEVLELLMHFAHFQLAEAWLIGSDRKKISLKARCSKTAEIKDAFDEESKINHFQKGIGLPGVTWEKRTVQYWNRLEKHPDFQRRAAAQKTGLKSAYGIPLFHNHQIIGVLSLALKSDQEPENIFPDLLQRLGSNIGAEVRRKQLEEELHQIFHSAPDIICIVGTDSYFKKVNPAMCVLLEYSEEELLSTPIAALVHPEDRDATLWRIESFITGSRTVYLENRYLTKSGKLKWLAWTGTKSLEDGFIFCVAKDITDRKELENLLEKTNNLARIGSWEVDLAHGTVYWSKITYLIHEASGDFSPDFDSATSLFKEGIDRETVLKRFMECIERGTSIDEELRIVTFEGNERWVRILGQAELINGVCRRIYGSFQDIDQQKKNSIELEESEKRYSNLFHLSPQPMWVYDIETLRFLDVNEAALRHYGYTIQEFMAMSIKDIRPEEDIAILENAIQASRYAAHRNYTYTFRHRKKEGEIIIVDVQSNRILYKEKQAKVILATDVTERHQYTAAIEAQNRKLKDISWIQSHVVRAPVARLMGLIDLMKNFENTAAEKEEMLNAILISVHELDRIIKDISEKARAD